jgi:hypothetical protein
MRSPISLSVTVFATAALVILAAAPASAHTSLIDVQPGEGDTVTEGTTVSLTFSDALLDLGAEFSVVDSGGDPVSLDVDRPDPASVAATLPALAAGPVTVSWRVVAKDGHPIEGTLAYVAEGVGPPASAPAAPSGHASAVPAQVTASPSPSPSPQPDTGDDSSSDGINWGVWIAIGVAIFAATGAGVATKRRS